MGCNVEFSKLMINFSQQVYTFGFEAYGRSENVKRTLDSAVVKVIAEMNVTGLNIGSSLSYPEFIARLEK